MTATKTRNKKPAKSKAPDRQTTVDLPDGDPRQARAISEISRMETKCQERESDYLEAKKDASEKKDLFEGAVAELRQAVRKLTEPMPLFDGKNGQGNGQAPAAGQQDEAWKEIPLKEALPDLPEGLLAKLADAEIETMGQLVAFQEKKPLDSLKGIKEKAIDKIEAAAAKFWEKRQADGLSQPGANGAPSILDHPAVQEPYEDWRELSLDLHVQNRRHAKKLEAPEVLLVNGPPATNGRELF